MVGVNSRNATTAFHSMTISLPRCIEVTTHNLHVTGRDVGHQRRDAVVKIDGFSCIGQRDYVGFGPSMFLYHEDVDFQISGEFSEF